MKLFIPELGTQLELTKDFSFEVMLESRNETFITAFCNKAYGESMRLHDVYYYFLNGIYFPHRILPTSDNRFSGISAISYDCSSNPQENDNKKYQICELREGNALRSKKTKQAIKVIQQLYPNGISYKEARIGFQQFRKDYPLGKQQFLPVILPTGTILEVDRIYIRQGASNFSSITFKIRGKRVYRFWIPLNKVNEIECKIVGYPDEKRKQDIPRCSIGG